MIKEGKFREDLFTGLMLSISIFSPLPQKIAPYFVISSANIMLIRQEQEFSNQTVNVLIDYSCQAISENWKIGKTCGIGNRKTLPEHLEYCFQSIHSEEQVFVEGYFILLKTAKGCWKSNF